MNPEKFLSTVYLGDRACKKILIDGWKHRFCLQIDLISRLKKNTDTWDYYNDEDIKDGWLIFTELSSVKFTPTGAVPNDLINEIKVRKTPDAYIFDISISSVSETGDSTEVLIQIKAQEIQIESNDEFLNSLLSSSKSDS